MKIGLKHKDTGRHGYYSIAPERFAEMPEVLKKRSEFYQGGNSFEEDCEWARICLAYPDAEEWSTNDLETAKQLMRDYNPEIYEEFYGVTLAPGESYKKDLHQFYADNKDRYVTFCACGDWHEDCPEGFVLVSAGKNCTEENRMGEDHADFLVPDEEYSVRRLGFVIDETRHKRLEKKEK